MDKNSISDVVVPAILLVALIAVSIVLSRGTPDARHKTKIALWILFILFLAYLFSIMWPWMFFGT